MNPDFHFQYKTIKEIGSGSHGVVTSAIDQKNGEKVAIKLIGSRNFEEQDEFLSKRALRELKILRHLHGHENISYLVDCDTNEAGPGFKELYLVVNLMETDLTRIIRSNQPLSIQHIQYFTYQIFRGLKFMHSANIIHRDLKPGNLLINSDCELRICDFGLARSDNEMDNSKDLTEYVATRYYRAPEVVLAPKHYSKAIDIWSVGCIISELFSRRTLFKGEDYIDQLLQIFKNLGTPKDPTLVRFCSQRVLKYLHSWPRYYPIELSSILPNCNKSGLDIISRILVYEPEARITAAQALSHPFVAGYHDETDEPDCPFLFNSDFESATKLMDVKELIWKEVQAACKPIVIPTETVNTKKRGRSQESPTGLIVHKDMKTDCLEEIQECECTNIEQEILKRN